MSELEREIRRIATECAKGEKLTKPSRADRERWVSANPSAKGNRDYR